MLADILYNLPGLLRNECFVRILKVEFLRLGTLNEFLVLEGQSGGFQVDQVSFILQNVSNGVDESVVWLSDLHSGQLHPMRLVVGISRRGNFVFLELLCNLDRPLFQKHGGQKCTALPEQS